MIHWQPSDECELLCHSLVIVASESARTGKALSLASSRSGAAVGLSVGQPLSVWISCGARCEASLGLEQLWGWSCSMCCLFQSVAAVGLSVRPLSVSGWSSCEALWGASLGLEKLLGSVQATDILSQFVHRIPCGGLLISCLKCPNEAMTLRLDTELLVQWTSECISPLSSVLFID